MALNRGRGGSARGPLGGGKRRDDEPDESSEEEAEDRSKKKGSARSGKPDSSRKRRTSSRDSAGRPPEDSNQGLKKAMFVATPIMAVVFLIILIVVMNQKAPEPPKTITIDYNQDVDKAKALRLEAKQLLSQANDMSENSQKKGPLLAAEAKLNEAMGLIDNVREKTGDTDDKHTFSFEEEAQRINELKKMVRTAIMESGAR